MEPTRIQEILAFQNENRARMLGGNLRATRPVPTSPEKFAMASGLIQLKRRLLI